MTSAAAVETRKGHNGWPNYQTWAVALWLGNEEVMYRFWMAVARGVLADAPRSQYVRELQMSEEAAAECQLADEIAASIKAQVPDVGSTVYADLLQSAIDDVDWHCVAKSMLEGVD